jgi:hypothetical protein
VLAMKNLIKSTDSKQFKRLLRNRNFRFTIIAYPVGIAVYFFLKNRLKDFQFTEGVGFWYTLLTFAALLTMIIVTLYEKLGNKIDNKRQGAKLQMKREEGEWRK